MVTIVTDSTADLSPELIQRFNIIVVPLAVTIANQTYQDGLTLNTAQLFKLVDVYNQLPKTAAPSEGDFLGIFSRPGEFFYTGLSSALSATFQNATLAARELPQGKVKLVDSLNLSTGIALLVCKAAELSAQGLTNADIASEISRCVSKVRTSFVIETMDYLYKGGRCSSLQHLVGSLLKIRPIIEVNSQGKMGVKDKSRGTRKKALDCMLTDLENHLNELDRHRIFVTHTGCDEDALYLAEEINKICAPDEVNITTAGSVIASHCGPDTIGILYLVK
ncbi:MAG: DegV family protein [Anaerolineae bacterium]|nr:DegV family protein [Anaerolineae bacterium]